MFYYYKVKSSHWPMDLEFRSEIKLEVGQCFRILKSNGLNQVRCSLISLFINRP